MKENSRLRTSTSPMNSTPEQTILADIRLSFNMTPEPLTFPQKRTDTFMRSLCMHVMDRDMHSPQEVRAILDLFEGEIDIYKKGPEKFLKIEKMINQKYSKSELSLQEEKLRE